jgi:hypothetical protein
MAGNFDTHASQTDFLGSNNNDLVTQLSRKKYETGGGMYCICLIKTLEIKQKKEKRK